VLSTCAGIPVSQQHLIWQSVELEDDRSLHEYQIHSGATLQLVLGMRGGPVNTRRGTSHSVLLIIVFCAICHLPYIELGACV